MKEMTKVRGANVQDIPDLNSRKSWVFSLRMEVESVTAVH
jgi:hypothetical protein